MSKLSVHARKFKRNKILATLGPATDSREAIEQLLVSGANGFRLNFSHGNHEEKAKLVKWIRELSAEYEKPVAVVQDLQGPKIRLGSFDGVINLKTDDNFSLKYNSNYPDEKHIPIQYDISKRVKKDQTLLLNDGKVRAKVLSSEDGVVQLQAQNNGSISSNKGVNLPDTDFTGDIITEKDIKDMKFGTTIDIDYVALSFVQSAKDIELLRTLLDAAGSDAKIIAKIETKMAAENLEEIVKASDAVMVARGDLALEVATESVPMIQRRIIHLGHKHKKISIVATQMLASMTDSPEPTRAEVSDVATAVFLSADCLMLSEETAMGEYPVETVAMMKRIILRTQPNALEMNPIRHHDPEGVQDSIAEAIISLSEQVHATAIVAETKSGATAHAISARRPAVPIAIATSGKRVSQQLALLYGGKVHLIKDSATAAAELTEFLLKEKVLAHGDTVIAASGQQPGVSGMTDTIKVRKLSK